MMQVNKDIVSCIYFVFSSRIRHTRYWRDWSSDVCSSDLEIQIGVIYDVMHAELYTAQRGRGAILNGEPIRVSGLTDMRQATVEAGWSPRLPPEPYKIGRASCRERGQISVVAVSLKKIDIV